MKTDADVAPDARELFLPPDLKRFGLLVEERTTLKATIKEAEEQIKMLDASLTELLTEYDAVKVQHGEQKVSLVQGSRSTLSKEKLLERGVPATVIADCTSVTTFNYIKVA